MTNKLKSGLEAFTNFMMISLFLFLIYLNYIKILKIDSDDENIKLDNVEFSLLNEKDEIVMTGKTNEKGELVFDSLPIGKYKIVETACKEGYIINEEECQDIDTLEDWKMAELKFGILGGKNVKF